MTTIQYVSDIHLEHRKKFHISPLSPNLALCGDIGYPGTIEYHEFVNQCSHIFQNVFVIYGNHEFFNSEDPTKADETMEERKNHSIKFPDNVFFLDNKSVYLDIRDNSVHSTLPPERDVTLFVKIIGTTLWSNIDPFTELNLADYKQIYTKKGIKLLWLDIIYMFQQNVKYVLQELMKDPDVRCILLSHHGAHPICNGVHMNNRVHSAYASYIPEFYKRNNLMCCISGHTHSSVDETLHFENQDCQHFIRFVSNQVGYIGEDTGYNESVIKV